MQVAGAGLRLLREGCPFMEPDPSLIRAALRYFEALESCEEAEVRWEDWIIKCCKRDLWLHRQPPFQPLPELEWRDGMELDLGTESGTLCLVGEAVDIPAFWKVRARCAGDRIRPLAHGPSRKIKQFFQAAFIPPWLRSGIPVLEWEGEPAALGDWVIGHRLQAWLLENELQLEWRPVNPVLMRLRNDNQRGL